MAEGIYPDSLMYNPPWQVNWSPRVGISHAVSASGKIFFNYGHFYQPPRSLYLFAINQRAEEGWSLRQVGNPKLKMEKTVAWEVGYEHDITRIYRLALSGYYRHVMDEVSRYQYRGNINNGVEMYFYRNDDYHDIRGFELKAEKRVGKYVTGSFNYDFTLNSSGHSGFFREYQQGQEDYLSLAENGSYAVTSYDSVLQVRETRDRLQLNYPGRGRIRISLNLHTPDKFGPSYLTIHPLGGIQANFLYQWTEGAKFTYNPTGTFYVSENMQWMGYRQTDLKLSKKIGLKIADLLIYMEVYNLFNTKNFNMITYFGSPEEDGAPYPQQQAVYYDSILENGYKLGETGKPGIRLPYGPEYAMFFPKRDIYFGMSISLR